MNYIGSKASLLDFIEGSILDFTQQSLQGKRVVDMFAGTGVVSKRFKELDGIVAANDQQFYSYVLNYFNLCVENSFEKDLDFLNSLEGEEGFFYDEFCQKRMFFTEENGKKCDKIRNEIEKFENKEKFFYCLASLVESIDAVANTASVYGAYLKKFKKSALKELYLKKLDLTTGNKGEVFCEDANILINKIKGDILYLDPPYVARRYDTNYHVLETIAKNDRPELRGKTALRPEEGKSSKWCSKREATQTFIELIKAAEFKYIFVSYSNEGLIKDVESILSNFGQTKVYTKEYRRFKADSSREHKASSVEEKIYCLKKC